MMGIGSLELHKLGTSRRQITVLTQVNAEWPLERLTRLMEILKGALTHPNSPDYRPDIDVLTPVHVYLVMWDLSEYCTLPFLAGFHMHVVQASAPGPPTTHANFNTQIDHMMLSLVKLYLRFKYRAEVYENGTLEAVYSVPAAFLRNGKKWSLSGFEFVTFPVYVQAYTIPIKLKYDFPVPSKFGNDLPPWKTATMCFLHIMTECVTAMSGLGEHEIYSRVSF
ncbi:hypothetical protein BU15DRAFT_63925 [Melanogaster broomeanus]|nr:hypothetical protein BU15DRAFT_63925 [Melanogaster broomeanus]